MNEPISKKRTEMNGSELKFITAYLLDFNVESAARTANISSRSGHRYLAKDYIQEYLKEHSKQLQEKCDVTLEQVVKELAKVAFFDHKSYLEAFDENGMTLKDFKNMDTSSISSMIIKKNALGIPTVEIKPYNKVDALKTLLDHLKGYQGPTDVHFHAESEEAKKMTSQEIAAKYQIMIQGD